MKSSTFCSLLVLCALLSFILPVVQAADTGSTGPTDEAIKLYNRADQYINVGDYKNALPLLEQALALNTTEFVASGARQYALLDKSKAQIELGDYSGALATIDQALVFEETDKLWNNRGYVLFRLAKYDEAVTAYDRAIKITPDYTIALINKGDALMKLSKYQNAIDAYTAAFAADAQANDLSIPQKAKTARDTGDAYAALGKYPEAIVAYKSSLTNDPGNADTAAALARAQQQADGATWILIAGVIAVIIVGGIAAYYLMKKKIEVSKNKKQGK